MDNVPGFREGLASAAAIWAAGPLAKSAIRNYCGLDALNLEGSVEELPHFGEEDKYSGATIIAMAATFQPQGKGRISPSLNSDILPADHQENCRLVMAGRVNDVSFRKEVEKLANNNPSIVFRDELDHVEVARDISSVPIS